MDNIFDLFNNRKQGIESLLEGTQIEGDVALDESYINAIVEAYEHLGEEFDLESVEESAVESLKDAKKKLLELEEKVNTSIYAFILKAYKNPKTIKKVIESDKEAIKKCDAILDKREENDDPIKLLGRAAVQLTVFKACPYLATALFTTKLGSKFAPSWFLRQIKKYNNAFLVAANKRIAELESKKDDKVNESTEIEEVNYESIEEALDALDGIVKESSMELIEFQSANYLEDLVLESMMFEEFDEEKISTAMEATMSERANKAAEMINTQWKKIKAWFEALFKAVSDFFTSGEKFVRENARIIPPAMKACDVKVKVYNYKGLAKGLASSNELIEDSKLNAVTKDASKAFVLSAVGARDLSDVSRVVKDMFAPGDRSEKAISSLDPKMAMDYAGNGKAVMDALRKSKSRIDNDFKEILNVLKSREADKTKNSAGETPKAVFDFAIAVKSKIIRAQMDCVKQGSRDFTAIIKKAVSTYKPTQAAIGAPKKELGAPVKESLMGVEFVDEVDGIDFE